jgi:methyl-accepting chemotaxis protein
MQGPVKADPRMALSRRAPHVTSAVGMTGLIGAPLELLRTLAHSARALAELPAMLERNLRDTNTLIAEARTQLSLLSEQVRRMMEQLDKMVVITDRLVDGASGIAEVAQEARRQMASTSEQLASTNRTLEQIVRMAEPLDRMGKRVAEGLLRVTGRGGSHEGE